MAAETTIDTIIANAISTASKNTDLANSAAQNIIDISEGISSTNLSIGSASTDISAIEPELWNVDDSVYTYESQLDKLIAILSAQLAEFFALYYPLEADGFDEATNWIVNSITNGGTGINKDIEDEIWQRARDRTISDGRRVQSQIILKSSSSGLTLPSGAMAQEVRQSLFEQAANNGITSTEIGKVQAEMEIANIKFAVELAVKSRMEAMGAACDYIRAIASSTGAAISVAELNTDAKAKMMSATATLYKARLQRDDMVMKTELANVSNRIPIVKIAVDKQLQTIDQKVRAVTSAADVYARVASSSLSSLNSVASTAVNAFS